MAEISCDCREMEERLVSAAVAVEGKSGTALARKIKTSIQTSEVPVATSMMRKTGAIHTALYR